MKKLILSIFIIIFQIGTFSLIIQDQYELSILPDVFADPVREEAAISGDCDNNPVSGFVADLKYTITISSGATNVFDACSATMELTNEVNGDTSPSITCDLNDEDGFSVLDNAMPTMKIGGLQCDTEDRSALEVNGDGSDNTKLDVAIDTTSSTDWDNSKKVDDATAGSKDKLFITGGQVGTAAIVDGSDYDASTNGEVAFGGTTASEGASKIYVKVDVTNYNVQFATDQETLTFTFTPE